MGEEKTGASDEAEARVAIERLPITGSDLFGRDEALAWLDQAWELRAHVVTIAAWGGVGKSCLVNAWLRRMRGDDWRGAGRVYGWSFYSQGAADRITSADEFIAAALAWFGDPDSTSGSAWEKGERLARLVREERVLLVLDGIEPLQWGSGPQEGKIKDPALQALVRGLGAQNTGLCVITSRGPVTDLDEHAETCQRLDLGNLSAEAGAMLLGARGAKGTDEELQRASEEYEGHCLALTLLGSYLEGAREGEIRRRDEIGPLEQEDARHGGRARRVMAAYEQWFKGEPELAVLGMLGLFDRPASEAEIAALRELPAIPGLTDALEVPGEKKWYHLFASPPRRPLSQEEWIRALARLRRAGLLANELDGEPDAGLDAHPLVREYFGEQLKKASPAAWREGHRRLFEHLKSRAEELPETIEAMAPLYSAVVHGCLAGRHERALREVFWPRIERGERGFNLRELKAFGAEVTALAAFFNPPWERLALGLSEADQGYILNEAGVALRALGRQAEAATLMRMALKSTIARESWKDAAQGAENLSELLLTRGDVGEALTYARQGIELAEKSGDAVRRMASRTTLADALHQGGREAEAAAEFEEADRMQKEQEPGYARLDSLRCFQYCDLLLDQGRDAEVLVRGAQTLKLAEEHGDVLSVALEHLSLGKAHLRAAQRDGSGDLARAAGYLERAIEGLRAAGQPDYLPLGLLVRADMHIAAGDISLALARRDLDEALSVAMRCGLRLCEIDAHLNYARLHLALDDLEQAQSHLIRARTLITSTGYHRRDDALARLEADLKTSQ